MKRVLIYRSESMLKPTGGPSGYLFNLRNGLANIPEGNIQVDFLPAINTHSETKNAAKSSKNPIIKQMLQTYRVVKHIKTNLSMLDKKEKSPVDLNRYDAVHFHTTRDLYFLREELATYRGKVLLTSHSPQPLSHEFIESSSQFEMKLFGKKYADLIRMDEYAFRRADYIIFPCEHADEPYRNVWGDYQEIRREKKEQYRYLLTGTVSAAPRMSRVEMRKKYGIPENAFVVSYVGRHSEIKGYDRLKEIGVRLLERNPDLYIFAAGNLGPLYPPDHERWIEVGWTNDPHSVVDASDMFVLPNKETYFDLVLLEVLSLGKTCVASNTGGNKYFSNEPGIKLYDTVEQAVALVEENMNYPVEHRHELEEGNRQLFQNNFTTERFAKNYLEVLKTIL